VATQSDVFVPRGLVPSNPDLGAAIVTAARNRLGAPYRFGAAGPDAYDCSGLVLVCVREATGGAVNLPHNAALQFADKALVPVKRLQLEPGDLVFFAHPVHHVGIYTGAGKMIDAPHTGAVVEVDALFAGFVGGRRVSWTRKGGGGPHPRGGH
jgi:cell wall-associated NlpC family hydrolase